MEHNPFINGLPIFWFPMAMLSNQMVFFLWTIKLSKVDHAAGNVLSNGTKAMTRSFPAILDMYPMVISPMACWKQKSPGIVRWFSQLETFIKTVTGWWWLEHLDYFSIQLGMSSSQLTSSIIFQKGGTTTFTGEFHSQPCLNKLEGIQDQLHLLHLHLACRVFFSSDQHYSKPYLDFLSHMQPMVLEYESQHLH